MSDMAGSGDPSDFVQHWLETFRTDQTINGDVAHARPLVDTLLLDPWPKLPNGKLDLAYAPFRLLAIVYRPDLSEGRFIFGALGPKCEALHFTVILEYGLPSETTPGGAKACVWAQRFHGLRSLLRTGSYNAELQKITDLFAAKDASPARSNGSAINQVRTGDSSLGTDGIWEIREFRLPQTTPASRTANLLPFEVASTPRESLNNTAPPQDQNLANIMKEISNLGTANSPLSQRGAKARVNVLWNAPGVTAEQRHKFAKNTCNGCHSGETGTVNAHVAPREAGTIAEISGFLSGITVEDPVNPTLSHTFNDLEARGQKILNLISSCS